MSKAGLYLLCSTDRLETAFFCGTARECVEVLGLRNCGTFYSLISKKRKFFRGFITVEKVKLKKEDL